MARIARGAVAEGRYHRHHAFRVSHGDEVANGMMEMLPPVGWADVVTKHDLAGVEERMNLRFALVDQRFELMEARLGERLERSLRVQSVRTMAGVAAMFTAFGLIDRLVLA